MEQFFGPDLMIFFGDMTFFGKSIPGAAINIFSYLAS